MVAPHRLSAEVSTVVARKKLETAYHRLRTANKQFEDVETEICRLRAARIISFPHEPKPRLVYEIPEDECRGFGDEGPSGPGWLAWWQRAPHTGLLGSIDNLDRELERLNALKTNLETIQSDLRCDIHEQSRRYSRKLNILDFPNEILLDIFELVEGGKILSFRDAFDVNREDMKNIRLVCRRFCAAGSHLLVRNVRVTFNEASLAHLEEVSRHPTIAKGVRSILVTFDLYNCSFLDFESVRRRKRTRPGDDFWETLYDRMLQPTNISHVEKHNLEGPNYQCLVHTIASVRSAGALFDSLTIDLSAASRATGTLVPAPNIRQKFSSGMRQMKNFTLRYHRHITDEDAGHLADFLSACLDTSSLTTLTLDLGGAGAQSARINLGHIIGSQPRHELTDIFLVRTGIEIPALVLLLQRLPDSMSSLEIHRLISAFSAAPGKRSWMLFGRRYLMP